MTTLIFMLPFLIANPIHAATSEPPSFTAVLDFNELMNLPTYKQEIYLRGLAEIMAETQRIFPSSEMPFDEFAANADRAQRSFFSIVVPTARADDGTTLDYPDQGPFVPQNNSPIINRRGFTPGAVINTDANTQYPIQGEVHSVPVLGSDANTQYSIGPSIINHDPPVLGSDANTQYPAGASIIHHDDPTLGSTANISNGGGSLIDKQTKSTFDSKDLNTANIKQAATNACKGTNHSQAVNVYRSQRNAQSSCIYAGNISTYSSSSRSSHCSPPNQFCVSKNADCMKCSGSKNVICNPLVFGAQSKAQPFCVSRGASATQSCASMKSKTGGLSAAQFMSQNLPGIQNNWDDFAKQFNDSCSSAGSTGRAHCSECYYMAQRLNQLNGKVGTSSKNYFDSNSGKAIGDSEGAR